MKWRRFFFGAEDPVGKILTHHEYGEFIVTGVLKPYKRNTHFRSEIMVSMNSYKQDQKEISKKDLSAYTYVLAREHSDKKDLDAALAMAAATTNKEMPSGSIYNYRKQ